MKKVIYLPVMVVVLSIITSISAFGQAARQGNIIIDPYYGGPNLGKAFLEAVEDENQGSTDFNARSIGPAGLRIEYMLGDRIGVGIDAIYNSRNISLTASDTVYDGNGDPQIETNQYEYDMKRLRLHLRFNYHFDISNPQLDGYLGLGAGTNNRFRTTYVNGVEEEDDLGDLVLIPFTMRVCVGTRYYFTDNIGINAELGIGGPIISGGLSFKF